MKKTRFVQKKIVTRQSLMSMSKSLNQLRIQEYENNKCAWLMCAAQSVPVGSCMSSPAHKRVLVIRQFVLKRLSCWVFWSWRNSDSGIWLTGSKQRSAGWNSKTECGNSVLSTNWILFSICRSNWDPFFQSNKYQVPQHFLSSILFRVFFTTVISISEGRTRNKTIRAVIGSI